MYRVCLVNMPFSDLGMPSIALSQLKSVVESRFKGKVSVEILYLNYDVARYLGLDLYLYLTNSAESLNTGLGDWFFRQVAFPELDDNTEKYLVRYFPSRAPDAQKLKNWIAEKRPGLPAFVEQLVEQYQLDKADVVGLTSMFMQNVPSFGLLRKIKERNPQVITSMGGANCEFPMGTVIARRVPFVDYVFSGPALKSFPEFLQRCMDAETDKCTNIRGIFSKDAFPAQSGPGIAGEELSIDTPIELDYEPFVELYEANYTPDQVKPSLPFETSRGCWWGERSHCTFCGLNSASMGYRSMNPEAALKQFNYLFSFSGRIPRLSGVDNILPKNYVTQVLPFLNTPPDMHIFYEVKADVSEQDMAALSRAGVTHVQPGIESLATSTLKLMRKGTTCFQNLKLLKLCALYSVQLSWNLLLGFPGEDEQVYRAYTEFLPLLFHLPPPTGAYPVRFDRFSPYYDQSKTYGLDLHPLDFYALVYPFEEADLKDLAYYFADRNIQAAYFMKVAKWIGKVRARVSQWQARWADQTLPPRLYFKKNSNTIYDSRSGAAVEYELPEKTRQVLDYLAKPSRMDDLLKTFPQIHGFDAAMEIASLTQKGLVFQEGDRFFTLVLDGMHGSRQSERNETALPAEQASELALVQIALS
jgi:ribosomal peptide maturation radical SAM protein 1